jgi:hypothetical protein
MIVSSKICLKFSLYFLARVGEQRSFSIGNQSIPNLTRQNWRAGSVGPNHPCNPGQQPQLSQSHNLHEQQKKKFFKFDSNPQKASLQGFFILFKNKNSKVLFFICLTDGVVLPQRSYLSLFFPVLFCGK